MAMTTRKRRTERLNVRLSDKEAKLMRLGAKRRGINLSRFILESACARAEQEIADSTQFALSSKNWQKFTEALDRPAQVKPRLKKLFAERTVLEHS